MMTDISELLAKLTDGIPTERANAASSLGIPPLTQEKLAALVRARQDLDGTVRATAVRSLDALGLTRGPEALAAPLVAEQLHDPAARVRQAARLALGLGALPFLLEALRAPYWNRRATAARALAELWCDLHGFGGLFEQVLHELTALAKDEREYSVVRSEAERALASILSTE